MHVLKLPYNAAVVNGQQLLQHTVLIAQLVKQVSRHSRHVSIVLLVNIIPILEAPVPDVHLVRRHQQDRHLFRRVKLLLKTVQLPIPTPKLVGMNGCITL